MAENWLCASLGQRAWSCYALGSKWSIKRERERVYIYVERERETKTEPETDRQTEPEPPDSGLWPELFDCYARPVAGALAQELADLGPHHITLLTFTRTKR